ncbi:MAG: class I tRNA ligase family protein, partial [Armatimonadota bacterium]|nr:class I tRNA ligase family protein [Armatimonadota bacterium]
AKAIYDFLWSTYADWYVELAKVDLSQAGSGRREQVQWTLWRVLEGALRLLHPIMPHITEEIWQLLPHEGESIMLAPWPQPPAQWLDASAEQTVERLIQVIRAIRSLRADMGLPPGASVAPLLRVADDGRRAELEAFAPYIRTLARAGGLAFPPPGASPPARAAAAAVDGVEVLLSVGQAEAGRVRHRLARELERVQQDLGRVEARLQSAGFLRRAAAEVVEGERRRQEELQRRRETLARYLASLAEG